MRITLAVEGPGFYLKMEAEGDDDCQKLLDKVDWDKVDLTKSVEKAIEDVKDPR